jgi:hypothetical protein
MQPTKVRIDKKVNNMADPRQIYQDPLKAYGLGLGGIRSMIGKQRSPFAEEGPSSTGIKSVEQEFSDDPLSGLNREEAIDYIESLGINTKNPSGAFEQLVDRANKRPEEIFTSEIQSLQPDVADFSEFSNSYSDLMSAIQPNATSKSQEELTEDANRIEEMPNNSTAFEESALDQIAATLAEAESPKTSNEVKDKKNPFYRDIISSPDDFTSTGPDDGLRGNQIEVGQSQIEEASMAAMNDYINAVRGSGPEISPVQDIDDYKKKFAEATGVDISGKVDKSHALMTFGLALMQNKAGKGFNVGKMLTSVGKAGESAMPALEKARERSRLDAIAGGKYALEAQAADETKALAAKEKAMERANYFVVPKSNDVKGFLADLSQGKGKLESLSKYELDKLRKDPEFSEKFDVLPGATWSSVVTEAMKTPEASELYLTKNPNTIPLFEGAGDTLSIRTFSADPNKNPGGMAILDGDGKNHYEALARMARDNQKAKEQFIELGILTDKNRNVFTYGVDSLNSLGAAFGIKFGENMPETARIKMVLEKLAMKNAPSILGESGKTISDGDRERVERIVGTLDSFGDIRVVRKKVEELFNDIVLSAEADIRQGLATLDRYTGRKIGSALNDGELDENERKEYEADLISLGVKL